MSSSNAPARRMRTTASIIAAASLAAGLAAAPAPALAGDPALETEAANEQQLAGTTTTAPGEGTPDEAPEQGSEGEAPQTPDASAGKDGAQAGETPQVKPVVPADVTPAPAGSATPAQDGAQEGDAEEQGQTYPADEEAGPGELVVGVSGSYRTDEAQRLLDLVNELRAEAAAEGVTDEAGTPVSGAPLAWSTGLEHAAQVRSAESACAFSHERPDGSGTLVEDGGAFAAQEQTVVRAECLAGVQGVEEAFARWRSEKQAYLDHLAYLAGERAQDTTEPYGNYALLVSDAWAHVAFGAFESGGVTYLVAELSDTASTSGLVRAQGACTQQIRVAAGALAASARPAQASLEVGQTQQLALALTRADGTGSFAAPEGLAWESSDAAVAEVDASGLVRAVSAGEASIAARVGDVELARVQVSVAAPVAVSVADPSPIDVAWGETPELPGTVAVTMSDGSVVEVEVAWEGNADWQAAGAHTLTATVGDTGLVATLVVNVAERPAPVIVGVEDPEPMSVMQGEAPELPGTVRVSWSYGEVTDEPVTWDESTADWSAPGTYTLAGAVEGTDLVAHVTVTVQEQARPASVVEPQALETPAGVAPELPARVQVRWTDGSTSEEDVLWDAPEASAYVPAGADVVVTGATAQSGLAAQVVVHVGAALAVRAEDPVGVSVEAGQTPVLPTTARVTWSDGSTTDEPVAWDDAGTDFSQPGVARVSGQAAGLPVVCEVSVREKAKPTVAAVANVAVTCASGTAPALPAQVDATLSDGTTRTLAVSWETPDPALYGAREGGSFTLAGTFALTDDLAPGGVSQVRAAVNVTPATVASVETPADVSTTAGVAPQLPATARVSWSNDDVTDEAVTWDAIDPARYASAGSFTATGTAAGAKVSATVRVEAAKATATKVAQVSVTTPAGVAPQLPATVQVSWDDGRTTEQAVTWATVSADAYAAEGTFAVSGTLDASVGLAASATVTVTAAQVTDVSLSVASVTTVAGVAPTLPASATATLTTGATRSEAIAWDAIDPSRYASAGSFVAHGTAAGHDVQLTVNVAAARATKAGNVAVTTKTGVAPQLPATVKVTWTDGSVTDEQATWAAVSAAQYAQAGTFTVQGTAANLSVSATVTVQGESIVKTGDATASPALLAMLAAGGVAAALAGVVLRLRALRSR